MLRHTQTAESKDSEDKGEYGCENVFFLQVNVIQTFFACTDADFRSKRKDFHSKFQCLL